MPSTASASAAPSPVPALTPIQEQVIAMITGGVPIYKVAQEANIHRNTIGNWRRSNPAFAQALALAQYERVLYWRDYAEEHAALAIETIGNILHDASAPPSVRLRAALAMLKHATTLPPAEPVPATPEVPAAEIQAACSNPAEQSAPAPRPISPRHVHPTKPQKTHNSAQRPTPKKNSQPPHARTSKAA